MNPPLHFHARRSKAGIAVTHPALAFVGHAPGALWFTEHDVNKIGRITTGGLVTEFLIPTASSWPTDIAAGPDGAPWFNEGRGNNDRRALVAHVIESDAVL